MTPSELHERCVRYAFQLEDVVLSRGRDLLTIWNSSNRADNPLRQLAGPDGKAVAINLMMSACLHEAILIVCAVLDARRHGRPLSKSNLVSFPVIADLMRCDGVAELQFADGDGTVKIAARDRFFAGVDRLDSLPAAEQLSRLRAYRDDYLAHALEHPLDRPTPVMGDLTTMMDAACILSGDCQLALFGRRVVWDHRIVSVEDSVNAVWRVLARD